jgi:hypothetical protein
LRFYLENGVRYRAAVKVSRLEKLVADRARMTKMLEQSGLSGISWRSTKTGFMIVGRYVGPSSEAMLPDRVTALWRLKG